MMGCKHGKTKKTAYRPPPVAETEGFPIVKRADEHRCQGCRAEQPIVTCTVVRHDGSVALYWLCGNCVCIFCDFNRCVPREQIGVVAGLLRTEDLFPEIEPGRDDRRKDEP